MARAIWIVLTVGCYASHSPCEDVPTLDQGFVIVAVPEHEISSDTVRVEGSDIDGDDGGEGSCQLVSDFTDPAGESGVDNTLIYFEEVASRHVDLNELLRTSATQIQVKVTPRVEPDPLGCLDVEVSNRTSRLSGVGRIEPSGIIRAELSGEWTATGLFVTETWRAHHVHVRIDPDLDRLILSGAMKISYWQDMARALPAPWPEEEFTVGIPSYGDFELDGCESISFGLVAEARLHD